MEKAPVGRMLVLEPEPVMEPEMASGSFWVAPKVPQLTNGGEIGVLPGLGRGGGGGGGVPGGNAGPAGRGRRDALSPGGGERS